MSNINILEVLKLNIPLPPPSPTTPPPQKRERTHGHQQQHGDCQLGEEKWGGVEENIGEIKDN